MRVRRPFRLLLAAGVLGLLGSAAFAAIEEKSLLAPDGTLYAVRAGRASELGVSATGVRPDDNVLQWTLWRQDGYSAQGMIPGTAGPSIKRNLDLAFADDSLILLWKEGFSVVDVLHLGIFRPGQGQWTLADLLPNLGISRVYNPQMLLSRQSVHLLDADGRDLWRTRLILSVIWWEESHFAQARYAPIFLDEDWSPSDVQVYDLPATIGAGGPTSSEDVPAGAYMYPALRLEGPSGAILASFADLNAQKQYVVRISYPDDLGKPGPSNATWMRRRIPVVGVQEKGPLALEAPEPQEVSVSTLIGFKYNPTLVWRDSRTIRYTRFDGKNWSSVKSIALIGEMSYDKAMRLVEEMASKN